ncbi:hypothetical protein JW962_02290 [Candidatus Dojkabacteria bacterium]|nr:hypothetical protein [Candidatus Dojkabacteria bacterium]
MITWNTYFSKNSESTKASKIFTQKLGNTNVFTIITLLGSGPFNAHTAGNMIWEKIKEVIMEPTESITEMLEEALKKSRQHLIRLIQNDETFKDIGIDFHVSIVMVQGKIMYIGNIGDNDLYIIRNTPIDIGKLVHDEKKIFQTGSGKLEDNDILILGAPNTVDAYIETQFSEDTPLHQWELINDDFQSLSDGFAGTQSIITVFIGTPESQILEEPAGKVNDPTNYKAGNITAESAGTNTALNPEALTPESLMIDDSTFGGKVKSFFAKAKLFATDTYRKIEPTIGNLINKVKELFGSAKSAISQRFSGQDHSGLEETKIPVAFAEPTRNDNSGLYKDYELRDVQKPVSANLRPQSSIGRKLKSFLSFLPIQPKVKPQNVGSKIGEPFYKKQWFYVAIVAVIGIFIIGGLIKSAKEKKVYTAYLDKITSYVTTVETIISEAERLALSGPEKRTELITKVDQYKNYIATESIDTTNLKEADLELKTRLGTAATKMILLENQAYLIEPVKEGENLTILFDTTQACNGMADPIDIAVNSPFMIILGNDKKSICVVNLSETNAQGVIIDNNHTLSEEPFAVSAYTIKDSQDKIVSSGFYVLDAKKGVIKIEIQNSENAFLDASKFVLTAMSALTPNTIGKALDIETYKEHLYFLNASESRVKKAAGQDNGFAFPQEYPGMRNDEFTLATDMLIDGAIYILTNSPSKILMYSGGDPYNLTIQNTTPNINVIGNGFTEIGETRPIYIIDHQEGYERILVFEKPTGEGMALNLNLRYQFRYQGSKENVFTDLKEVFPDEYDNYLYVLDDTLILKIVVK